MKTSCSVWRFSLPPVPPLPLKLRRSGCLPHVVVTVVDATPPAVQSATANPSVLSPANHQLVAVTLTVSAADGCGGSVRCRITSVTSNEPPGDDWIITGDLTLKLRAERLNKATGRIYTITLVCTDGAGNEATRTVTASVPR